MSGRSPETESSAPVPERRGAQDRRNRTLHGLIQGNLTPRRRDPRRLADRGLVAVDWHHPQWLAVALLIVLLSIADAFFTLTLLAHGAYEANPLMASLLQGSRWGFAFVKIGLTCGGVVLLTALARMRLFGRVPIGPVLYLVLLVYGALVGYEYRLCNELGLALN